MHTIVLYPDVYSYIALHTHCVYTCTCVLIELILVVYFHYLQGQIINVPDTQPPVFLGHYNFPISNVSLKFVYLSPIQCPLAEWQKLPNTTVIVPRGGSVLNALEIAANYNPLASFECGYVSGLGYFLEKLNNVPTTSESAFCKWSWTADPQVFQAGTVEFSVSSVFVPQFLLHQPEFTFTYQHVTGGALPPRAGSSSGPPSNTALVSPRMNGMHTHLSLSPIRTLLYIYTCKCTLSRQRQKLCV